MSPPEPWIRASSGVEKLRVLNRSSAPAKKVSTGTS